jgi:hypothetical protein
MYITHIQILSAAFCAVIVNQGTIFMLHWALSVTPVLLMTRVAMLMSITLVPHEDCSLVPETLLHVAYLEQRLFWQPAKLDSTFYTVGHKNTKNVFTITFLKLGWFRLNLVDFSQIHFTESAYNHHLTRVPASHYQVKLESH